MSAAPLVGQTPTATAAAKFWWPLAAIAVVASTAVSAHIASIASHPTLPFDEISQLQIARLVSGRATPPVAGAGYFPGWGILLAPVWWFTSNPQTAYIAAIWVGVAVSVITLWPLTRLVTRFGVSTPQALAIAATLMALPSRALQANFALGERLLFLTVVLVALAAYRFAEHVTVRRGVVFAAMTALMLLTHARVIPVIAACGVWLVLMFVRHRRAASWTAVALVAFNLISLVVSYGINYLLMGHRFKQGQGLFSALIGSNPGLDATVSLGQAWYQAVATFGLIGIGFATIAVIVWRELRSWQFGGATLMFGMIVTAMLASWLSWLNDWQLYFNPWVRLDVWLYGRYADPFTVLLFAVALAALVRLVGTWAHAAGGGAIAVIMIAAIFWVGGRAPTWGYVTPAHLPGILPLWRLLPTKAWERNTWMIPTLTGPNRFWVIVTIAVLAFLVVTYLMRRRPALIVAIVLVLATAGSAEGAQFSQSFSDRTGSPYPVARAARATLRDLDSADKLGSIAYDRGCTRRGGFTSVGQNYWGYWLTPLPMHTVNTKKQNGVDAQVFVACDPWEPAASLGARRLHDSNAWASSVWILPGPIQDELARKGRLD